LSRGGFEVSDANIGYRADFHRDAGPNADAPFAVAFPYYDQVVETVSLPTAASAYRLRNGEDVDQTIAGVSYQRRASVTGNVFRVEVNQRSLATGFPASEAPAAQAALRALADRSVYVLPPTYYRGTDADIATTASAPTDANGFVRRGTLLVSRNQ